MCLDSRLVAMGSIRLNSLTDENMTALLLESMATPWARRLVQAPST
jgi:hypothetical protein